MVICPVCEKGKLKPAREKNVFYGVDLGTYPVQKCDNCGETFTASSVMAQIEMAAKKKGVWGLGRRTKISKSGNSLSIRIPKEMVQHFGLKDGTQAYIHPEKNKMVVDFD